MHEDTIVWRAAAVSRVAAGLPRRGPAAQRDEQLDLRMTGLELLQLIEVAFQRLIPRIAHAVHGRGPVVGLLIVRIRIAAVAVAALGPSDDVAATVIVDVAEGIVDERQLRGRAARVDVLHVIVAPIDAPLREVGPDLFRAAARILAAVRHRDRDVVGAGAALVVRHRETEYQRRARRDLRRGEACVGGVRAVQRDRGAGGLSPYIGRDGAVNIRSRALQARRGTFDDRAIRAGIRCRQLVRSAAATVV